jgi:hypothetical protein
MQDSKSPYNWMGVGGVPFLNLNTELAEGEFIYFYFGLTNTITSIPPPHGTTAPSGPGSSHCRGFAITRRHTTLGRTPLDE